MSTASPSSAPIYLDAHATTAVDPRVVEAMLPYFTSRFGNAGSRQHAYGWQANEAVERARGQVAQLVGAHSKEIVFTAGATESNNTALKGFTVTPAADRDHVVTLVTEHHSVLDPCRRLERDGWRVTRLTVGQDGAIDLTQLREAVGERTALVSVMAANNEIGVCQPLAAVAEIAHARGALLHSDIVPALGRLPVDLHAWDVDAASLSAHKVYGPKGIGALFLRRRQPRLKLTPLLDGGGQEWGMRAGTLNVPAIVGFGEACQLASRELAAESARLTSLCDRLLGGLRARIDGLVVNGPQTGRLPGNLNVSIPGVDGDVLLKRLTAVAVSSGAACTAQEPSHVLLALGHAPALALASLRFGLGRWTTAAEIDAAVEHVASTVARLRSSVAA